MKTAITSGFYVFPHCGHVDSFQLSRALADQLIVIVNNDAQLAVKKGSVLQPAVDRLKIVQAFRYVDRVVLAVDEDQTVCKTLELLFKELQTAGHEVIFTKSGDRFKSEVPEKAICEKYGVQIVDGLGAKTHSSSQYIENVLKAAGSVKPS